MQIQLQLYLDDCAYSKELQRLLVEAGCDVQIPVDVQLVGADDPAHFDHAPAAGRVLITKNPADFKALHDQNQDHRGVVAIYQDNSPRDMAPADIVHALENAARILAATGQSLEGTFINLNEWQF